MEKRVIFHVDVNSAFLSWSAVKRLQDDPDALDLRTIPSAVGGDVTTRHGVITAKSIPAKAYGVTTGEPVVKALEKCPGLILVPSDFETYRTYSRAFMTILQSVSDLVEQASIDEAYVDMTGLDAQFPPKDGRVFPETAAYAIKDEIRDTLGFTVNIGISDNKLLAKMASDFKKPDRVHTLYTEEVPLKLWPLPVRDLFGCGKSTEERLLSLGMRTIGDIAASDPVLLSHQFGEKMGQYLYRAAHGIDHSPVHTEHEDAKSISNETTTSEDITRDNWESEGKRILHHLCEKVAKRVQKEGVLAGTIGVMAKSGDFKRFSRQVSLQEPTDDAKIIEAECIRLFDAFLFGENGAFAKGLVIRLIGVSASGFMHEAVFHQLTLTDFVRDLEEEKQKKESKQQQEMRSRRLALAQEMAESVNQKYGDNTVRPGFGAQKKGKNIT